MPTDGMRGLLRRRTEYIKTIKYLEVKLILIIINIQITDLERVIKHRKNSQRPLKRYLSHVIDCPLKTFKELLI